MDLELLRKPVSFIDETCRLCMRKDASMLPLFVEGGELSERIMNFAPALKLCRDDGLPAQVCLPCVLRVHECYSFKQQCETTDATLREMVFSRNSKDEHFEAITVKEEQDISMTVEEEPLHFGNFHDLRKEDIKLENEQIHETVCDILNLEQENSFKNKEICFDIKSEITQEFSFNNIKYTSTEFECDKCYEKFSSCEDFETHAESHAQDTDPEMEKVVCHICRQLFKNKRCLKVHMLIHNVERPFACNVCTKSYNRKKGLKDHMVIHSGEKPHACDQCGVRFSRTSALRVHKTTHTGERKYICEKCGKKFRSKVKLQAHNFSHTGEKLYECEICSKKFSRKYCLVNHIRVHMGEQPFSCSSCGKQFHQKARLKEHLWTHSGKKPYSCEHCGKGFMRMQYLKYHLSNTHSMTT